MTGTSPANARLGALVIHNDPVPEIELGLGRVPGVSVHAARFECPRPVDGEYTGSAARALAEAPDVVRGLDQLGRLGADCIALCFGSSSFFGGQDFDREFTEVAEGFSHGVPVFTAATAMTAAMRAGGVRRPLAVMPPWFTEPTFRATEEYLAGAGMRPCGLLQFDLGPRWEGVARYNAFDLGARWEVHPQEVCDQVLRGLPGDADGILLPGSGFRSWEAIVSLERETGLPVVTSNQAVLWYGLALAGGPAGPPGGGRLMDRPGPPPAGRSASEGADAEGEGAAVPAR
ncbi:hypothetical protein [Streptomyces thermolineatus]|uniref:aspartate racemase/maleate isomerase family protein n=1 Tax=Streptomyces thermolineatus TaxID=44033 RepID=UPI003850A8CF